MKAYEVPDAERTPEQERLAAPVTEALEKGKLTVQFTPKEKEEQGELYARMAEAVLAVPENPAHGIHYDGLMEMPTASVLGHREPALIPDVYILNRGDLGNPKRKFCRASRRSERRHGAGRRLVGAFAFPGSQETGPVADPAGSSAHFPGYGESPLGVALWQRYR